MQLFQDKDARTDSFVCEIVQSEINICYIAIYFGLLKCILLDFGKGPAAQIPAFYMDTSHLFNTQHARLAPPTLTQQQAFQPGLSQVSI